MICTRFGIDFVTCKTQILQARGLVYGARAIATATQRTLATQNLLAFFAEVYGTCMQPTTTNATTTTTI